MRTMQCLLNFVWYFHFSPSVICFPWLPPKAMCVKDVTDFETNWPNVLHSLIFSNDAKKCEFWTWNGAKKSASFKKAANPSNFTYENQLRDSREQTFQNFGDRYTGMPCSTEGPSTLNYIELSCASWNRSQDIWSPPIHSNCSSKLTEKSVTFRERASRMSRAIDTLRSQLSCALPQGALCDDLRKAECAYH